MELDKQFKEMLIRDYDRFIISSETDLNGIITYASVGFCNISGYTKDELLGSSHNIVRDPSVDKTVFNDLWVELKKKKTVCLEMKNLTKSKEEYWVYSEISPLYNNGIHVGYRALRKDITNEKRLKNKIFEYELLTLENANSKSQNHETKKIVVKSKKEMSTFKDNMIAIFTHELKTPLNAIISFSQYTTKTLQRELTPKKIEKLSMLSKKITSNGLIQLNMIENLLEIAKIQSNQIVPQQVIVNMRDFILPHISVYKDAYNKKVTYDIDPTLNISLDKKLCGMIFDNLYSNALKYGKSQVHVSFKRVGKYFDLSIEDDGDGIPNDEKEKIFKMFEQADTEVRNNNSGGTGIGLYTVKVFTTACDKEVILEDSKLLGGSKFIVRGKE